MTVNRRRQMDPSLEIRKLSPRYVRELSPILETHELWKRLMAIIPKALQKNNFACDVTVENHHKYNSEHFKLIENASVKFKRACTEILLDEWGTSGRVRPALGHLLYLLVKAKLFRAADYVAVDLLHQEKPQRPSIGPEALIPIILPEPPTERVNQLEEIKRLDEIGYTDSAVILIRLNSEEVARHQNVTPVIPQIVVSPVVDEDNRHVSQFTMPLVVHREKTEEIEQNVSDMMKFSTSVSNHIGTENNVVVGSNNNEILQSVNIVSESQLPNFDLMNESVETSNGEVETQVSSEDFSAEEGPAFSELLGHQIVSQSNVERPVIQELNAGSSSNVFPNLSIFDNSPQADDVNNCRSDDLPNLSILNIDEKNNVSSGNFMPDFDALKSTPNNIAEVSLSNISGLGVLPTASASSPNRSLSVNISTHLLPTSVNSSPQNSSDNSTKSRPCASPLPNLSLNTLLPHFSYSELETATNGFNTDPYTGPQENGRFLGSGAFGSVFLALGLFDKPVAVKKLILEDVEVVNVDDTVTKQFRNEVEVLSRYKHDNLLSLLGYSSDGFTYCLMYEYISGGSLKDRLQARQDKLLWKERLSIALGTAKAVSYLHTAFSTPLIHRDIKSANILLDSKNNPKLADFGLIKLSPSQNTNVATTVFGTSAYMAQEAFRGDISVKLDTFSFGVVLLELLTSLPPMDENRDGTDLVTHIVESCENDDVMPFLDQAAGSWLENDVNFADELFQISLKCLEEKKKRPNMVEATALLQQLLNKSNTEIVLNTH